MIFIFNYPLNVLSYLPQNVEYCTGQETEVHRETEILNLVLNRADLAVHQRHCIHNTTYRIRSQVKVSPSLTDTHCTCYVSCTFNVMYFLKQQCAF